MFGTVAIWSMRLLRRLARAVTVQDPVGAASSRFVPRWLDFCSGEEAARRRSYDDMRIFKQQQGGAGHRYQYPRLYIMLLGRIQDTFLCHAKFARASRAFFGTPRRGRS